MLMSETAVISNQELDSGKLLILKAFLIVAAQKDYKLKLISAPRCSFFYIFYATAIIFCGNNYFILLKKLFYRVYKKIDAWR